MSILCIYNQPTSLALYFSSIYRIDYTVEVKYKENCLSPICKDIII